MNRKGPKATFINKANANMFLPVFPEELAYRASFLIGCIDEAGIACGGMAVEEIKSDMDMRVLNILYLYVHPFFRGLGEATAMFSLLISYATQQGIKGIMSFHKDNSDIYGFLDEMGLVADKGGKDRTEYTGKLTEWLDKLPQKEISANGRIITLSESTAVLRNHIYERSKKGWFNKLRGSAMILPLKYYDQDLSHIALDDDEYAGSILIRKEDDTHITMSHIEHCGHNERLFLKLLQTTKRDILDKMGDDVMIRITPVRASEKKTVQLSPIFLKHCTKTIPIRQFLALNT